MQRKEEAAISRISLSRKKTIYVEGDIDKSMIGSYLDLVIPACNVNVLIISSDIENGFGAKQTIINFIKRVNNNHLEKSKYMGIVDSDYDDFLEGKEDIDNLIYTDMNSMESYLINEKVMKSYLLENRESDLVQNDIKLGEKGKKFFRFSLFFYFQRAENLSSQETVDFDRHGIYNNRYICNNSHRISIKTFIKDKITDHGSCRVKFLNFLKSIDMRYLRESGLGFLHGKYFLNFIIYLLKLEARYIRGVKKEIIANSLKDKFLLNHHYNDFALFDEIKKFVKD